MISLPSTNIVNELDLALLLEILQGKFRSCIVSFNAAAKKTKLFEQVLESA